MKSQDYIELILKLMPYAGTLPTAYSMADNLITEAESQAQKDVIKTS
jgi:hypothetical protein